MPDSFRYDVFLSHNAQDKPRVRRLAERLKAAGVQMEPGLRLWLDEWVIQAGDIIALKVDEGLEQSRVLLLVPDSQLSTLNSQPPTGRRFISLLLGDCVLPDTLRRYMVVDFREESDAALAEVLATGQAEMKTTQRSPEAKSRTLQVCLSLLPRTGELNASTPPIPNASVYTWRVALASAPDAYVLEQQKSAASDTFEGLTPGQIYLVDVNAVGSAGPSDWSDTAQQMVL